MTVSTEGDQRGILVPTLLVSVPLSPSSLADLNPEQQKACDHMEGPLLVLAGAGSGKTMVITYRISRLLELGIPASGILAVTFTNKAAEEMRQRVRRKTQQSVLACTFHSLASRLLRESIHHLDYRSDFAIYDTEDSEKVLKEALLSLDRKEGKGEIREIHGQISRWKQRLLLPDEVPEGEEGEVKVYAIYQRLLKFYNALDFDDLLLLVVRLLRQFPDVRQTYQQRWSFILIDEYQDTNPAQAELIHLLAEQHHNVFAVGDPDQSIYSWRGADVGHILRFEQDFPGAKVVSLEENYRSRGNILDAANALIRHNARRYPKNLWSSRGPGEKIRFFTSATERLEADTVVRSILSFHKEGVRLSDQVIFYRTNFQSRVFEDLLLRHQVPYRIIGGISFYDRREIKDVLCLLRLVLGGSDYVAFARTVNLPKRGMGDKTIRAIEEAALAQALPVMPACKAALSGHLGIKLNQKQNEGLRDYLAALEAAHLLVLEEAPLHEIIQATLDKFRYVEALKEEPDTYQDRRENVEELLSKAKSEETERRGREGLVAFLEELSLASAHDTNAGADQDCLNLMTLHHGKGLEFAHVYLVGLEEELFPHANSCRDETLVEEERRLCYVGMTRAKERLFLSSAQSRFLWGVPRTMRPSRFLKEIPTEYCASPRSSTPIRSDAAESFSSHETTFPIGARVLHKDFGQGTILRSYTTSLGAAYDVNFPQGGGTRSLIAKYAKLQQA